MIGLVATGSALGLAWPVKAEAGPIGNRICRVGRRYIGTPYVTNGASLRRGIDCDGYVRRVLWDKCGIWVPWGPGAQHTSGRRRRGEPRPGDVVSFAEEGGNYITHVGIYSGYGYLLHASSYFNEVVESEMRFIRGYRGATVYR
jgi:cell wall-associated NlpC family hydrolase